MKDHLGREVSLRGAPSRVVSLVPSITESVLALGGALVGRTHFCPEVPGAKDIGGTKKPHVKQVLALAPDLVLANQEENRPQDVEALAREAPVFVTDVRTVAAALAWVEELRALLRGDAWSGPRGARVSRPTTGRRAVTLIWKKPHMLVGEDTYAADLLRACGIQNALPDSAERYPKLSLDEIAALRPDLVILPSEPYPWVEAEAEELESELSRRGAAARAMFVPGDALTWWGVRTERALAELKEALR